MSSGGSADSGLTTSPEKRARCSRNGRDIYLPVRSSAADQDRDQLLFDSFGRGLSENALGLQVEEIKAQTGRGNSTCRPTAFSDIPWPIESRETDRGKGQRICNDNWAHSSLTTPRSQSSSPSHKEDVCGRARWDGRRPPWYLFPLGLRTTYTPRPVSLQFPFRRYAQAPFGGW